MEIANKIGLERKDLYVCRCCLKQDGFKDISTEYIDFGERETYEDMLKDTFNIQISLQIAYSCKKRLICECCITSLRDASSFKRMVVQSEETLMEYLQNLECHDDDVKLSELDVETIKVEPLQDTMHTIDIGEDQAGDSNDDDEILANIKLELTKTDGATLLKPRKRKRSHDKKSKSNRSKIKEDHEVKMPNEPPEKDWSKIAERRGTGPLLRENSLKLIQNSTLSVFQWNKSRYRCFCCKEPFSDIDLLKEHTINSHTIENIEKKIILQQNRLVKVEISSLHCKICQENLADLSKLKQHLSETHSMAINEHLLVPFKIENELKCQICFEKFTVFRLLNIHMNKHFQKQVCHVCGAGFSNLVFLNLHRTRSHRPLSCKACDVTFNNKIDKKNHDITIHDIKYERKLRFPCPFCPQRFFQENFRVRHLVESHGMPQPDFKCSVCFKSFLTRSLCNNHVKNVHNKEKNHECDLCHNFFYTKSDVARHRVTHTGEKKYSCTMCNNPFATRDSLRRHMKRTHVGINEFCETYFFVSFTL